jgi:hypothetical protein
MDYNEFDNTIEYKGESEFSEIHKLIIEVLTEKPLSYYKIFAKMPDHHSQYQLSGQLQFLKKKEIVEIKQFGYERYWGLTKKHRQPGYIKERYK